MTKKNLKIAKAWHKKYGVKKPFSSLSKNYINVIIWKAKMGRKRYLKWAKQNYKRHLDLREKNNRYRVFKSRFLRDKNLSDEQVKIFVNYFNQTQIKVKGLYPKYEKITAKRAVSLIQSAGVR